MSRNTGSNLDHILRLYPDDHYKLKGELPRNRRSSFQEIVRFMRNLLGKASTKNESQKHEPKVRVKVELTNGWNKLTAFGRLVLLGETGVQKGKLSKCTKSSKFF